MHKFGLLGGIEKMSLTLPHQGIEPRVFRFEQSYVPHHLSSRTMTYNVVTAGLEGRDHHLDLSTENVRQTRGLVHTMVLSANTK